MARTPIEGVDRESLLSCHEVAKTGSIPVAAGVVCKVNLDASCCKCLCRESWLGKTGLHPVCKVDVALSGQIGLHPVYVTTSEANVE